jgi:geranylgeranyl pyrophosphate synthase
MDIPQLLQHYAQRIDAFLHQNIPPHGVDYVSEGIWYQFSSGGKRLRPALCLLTCEHLGGDPDRAMPFALAAEILHNVFLIHDDIEDGDTMRRDQPTLWVHLDVANAINIGDYLTAMAYRLLLTSALDPAIILRLVDIYSLTFQKTVEGQALDINLRGCETFDVQQYYRIVQLKTAYYLTFNLVGGAIVAGRDDEVIEQLWALGRSLGPAFQIRDDIIDLTHGKGRGGEIGCDIREGKPSVLFAYALERLSTTSLERRQLLDIIAKPREQTTPPEVDTVIRIYKDVGALDFADAQCQRLIDNAFTVIEELPLEETGKALFRAISQFMIDRQT